MKKQPPENPILTVVKAGNPVNENGELDRFGDLEKGNFGIRNFHLVKFHDVKDKAQQKSVVVDVPLFMNGCALIDYEIVADDGATETRYFVIIGKLASGFELPPIKVPISKFAGMAWPLDCWGNKLIIAPGNGNKDNARAAMQILSGDVRTEYEYRHTGWRKIDGAWHFLSGGGAVHADGFDDQIRVELDAGHMQLYSSPPPTDDGKPHAKLLLEFLDISKNKPYIGATLLLSALRAPLCEAQETGFSIMFTGITQSNKSSVASLALSCFGDFAVVGEAGLFPGGFKSSALDLNIKAHQAKDVVFVADEFNPNSHGRKKAEEMHDTIETLCRSAGNRDGRSTRTADHAARVGRYPRGLLICTGEDMPQSQSLLGRMLAVDFKRGDVDIETLTRFQQNSKDGKYRQAMASYLQWLAPRMDELKTSFPKRAQAFAEEARKGSHHGGLPNADLRHINTYASLTAGLDLFIDYLQDAELIGDVRANDLFESTKESLKALIRSQREYQEQSDEVNVFRALLQACFTSGKVHVGNHLTQGPPKTPHQWGWRKNEHDERPSKNGEYSADEEEVPPLSRDLFARGELIGWINEDKQQLWLEKHSTFSAIQKLASAQGDPFTMKPATLWRRLLDRDVLRECEADKTTGKPRPDVYRAVGGGRRRVLIFPTHFITNANEPD